MKPTDSELEILQILWEHQPCSVRQVNEMLNLKRKIGYTTTLKLMQIMYEKGILERDDSQRKHLYTSNVYEADTKRGLLKDFMMNTFGGSVKEMVLSALGNGEASEEEIKEIKKIIADLENNK